MMYTVSYQSYISCPEVPACLTRPFADIVQILDFCYLVFVYFMYPETKNLTLEEVAKVFDGNRSDFEPGMVTETHGEQEKEDVQIDVKRV